MKYTSTYWKEVGDVIRKVPNINTIFHKRILITGATGMVCSSIVDILIYLNRIYNAGIYMVFAGRSIDRIKERFGELLNGVFFQFCEYDATKTQELSIDVDYIIHGASNANPIVYAKEPVETLLGNIVGLKDMLDLARRNSSCRILYISSSEVYGSRINQSEEPFREEDFGYVDILNPRACYPCGKRTAETLCASYRSEYNVDFVVVRPGHIYGPSITRFDSRASAVFTREAAAGHDIVMKSSGEQLRSYCYTLDCASAILTVLIKGESGKAYNISNKDSVVSIKEIAEAIAKVCRVRVVFEKASEEEKKGYNLMSNSSLNADKLEQLGWEPVFSLEKGVEATIRYFEG